MRSLSPLLIDIYGFIHPIDGAEGIIFSHCPSDYVCVRPGGGISDRLAVDF